uniref:Uncharacterized protein n=1 Tax=Cacopsylla melanoneura TaxID=428564 RepID=A0A8D9BPM0_9HEMI
MTQKVYFMNTNFGKKTIDYYYIEQLHKERLLGTLLTGCSLHPLVPIFRTSRQFPEIPPGGGPSSHFSRNFKINSQHFHCHNATKGMVTRWDLLTTYLVSKLCVLSC